MGEDPPFFNRSPFVSLSIQKQSNTFSMTKVSCRRAVTNITGMVTDSVTVSAIATLVIHRSDYP